jgi:hypothetical protein
MLAGAVVVRMVLAALSLQPLRLVAMVGAEQAQTGLLRLYRVLPIEAVAAVVAQTQPDRRLQEPLVALEL